MCARRMEVLPLVLAVILPGCISDDEWLKYNKAPGAACATADECASCPEDATWECQGPPGDEGICRAGLCRASTGEIGLNCSAEQPDRCDYEFCVYAGVAERGVCSKTCDDGYCPGDRFTCLESNRSTGGVMYWCAQKCAANADCDSNTSCQTLSGGLKVCMPGSSDNA